MAHSSTCRILVTGGTGFLGSHLARRLAESGHSVLCVDRRSPQADRGLDRERIAVEQLDVRDREAMDRSVASVDRVLHLASVVGVDDYLKDPADVLETGVVGSMNVLAAARRHEKPVVVASTSEVYGKNSSTLREDSDRVLGPTHVPRWSYSAAKAAAEHYAFALAGSGLCFLAVRYFNVYGPLLDAPGQGRVVSKFLGALRDGRPLTLTDGGSAVRSLCYVDDAVEATLRLLFALEPGSPVAGRAFNVGRAEPVTMRELAELMIRLSGREVGVRDVSGGEHFGEGFEEIPYRVPDLRALEEAVGFRAEISLREGLTRTLAHWGLSAPSAAARPASEPRLPAIRPVFEDLGPLLRRIERSLGTGQVTNGGPSLAAFESRLAEHFSVDAQSVAAVSSGASALLLAVRALGLRGKVVLPAFTYIASLAAVTENGLEPLFCDIDPATWTLSATALERILEREQHVAAVVAVNVYGIPPDLERIRALCTRVGASLVYDDAHGFGTTRNGTGLPGEPDVIALSFHATKLLPAVEGGAVLASDSELVAEIRRTRNHGLSSELLASSPAYNAKLDELRALVGLHQLERIDGVLARRRAYGERLRHAVAQAGAGRLELQQIPPGVATNHQNFAVVCSGGEHALAAFAAELGDRGVEARRYFHPALHWLTGYAGRFDLPETDRVARSVVCLPLYDRMTEDQLVRIEQAVEQAVSHAR